MAESKPAKSLASFGEQSAVPKPSTALSVKGAERMLVITELQRVGENLGPTGVSFKFSKENFSAPRGPQQFGLSLRTMRTDLPGSEDPVEQVLGWNYEPFTVKGVWDDRHAGAGYAEQTCREFRDMVKRGNPVSYQFEQTSFRGLITKFEWLYVRKDYQTYSFTISPHKMRENETVRVDSNKFRKVFTDPRTAVLRAQAGLDAMKRAQALASFAANARVQQLLKTGIFAELNDALDTVEQGITSAKNLVDKELLGPIENATKALNRGAQIMNSVKTAQASILSKTKSLNRSTHMSLDSVAENLKFETWHRSLSGATRLSVVEVEQSRRDFAYRAQPKPKRLHRVRQGESLYQISTRYYGTPHHWRDILAINKLSSIILQGGELLEIPELKL